MNPMHKTILATIALFSLLSFQPVKPIAAEPPAGAVDIRSGDGTILVAAHQIVSYDWPTHTISLKPGTLAELKERFLKDAKLSKSFAITIAGKTIYEGKLTTSVSSISLSTPVILVDPPSIDPQQSSIRIQLGYPTADFFRGQDPRGDARLRTALRATGKLAKPPAEYTQWIADSLREIQSLKPGMTRADLLKIFEEEGGLSTRFERRYAYRDCPYIKINVKFDPTSERPDYKISQISQPFLEWPVTD
jgi:hypothetical protein